jgi:hypothetical protein
LCCKNIGDTISALELVFTFLPCHILILIYRKRWLRIQKDLEERQVVIRVADPDPHYFGKLDLYFSEKLDPDPHVSQNLGAIEDQKWSQ